MLSQDKKVDLYFHEALRCMSLFEVGKTVKDCVSARLPQTKEQVKFWDSISKNPQAWKAKMRKHFVNIMNFTWQNRFDRFCDMTTINVLNSSTNISSTSLSWKGQSSSTYYR